MSSTNRIEKLVTLVRAKYQNDVALVTIVDSLILAQAEAAHAHQQIDSLSSLYGAYAKGMQGEEGYYAGREFDSLFLRDPLRFATVMVRFSTLYDTLVCALQRLGEEVEDR